MIPEALKTETEKQYGPLIFFNDAGNKITFLNEQGFAELYRLVCNPVFIPAEKLIYLYDSATGLWTSQRSEIMLNRLGLFLHECAKQWDLPLLDTKRKSAILSPILRFLTAMSSQKDFFHQSQPSFIHCANGVLKLDADNTWTLNPFSPDYRSRNRCELPYIPNAMCPRFLHELLQPLVENDDISLLQQYIGQCVTGKNITQSILLLTGPGGSGKGTLANIVEMIIGNGNFTQIRPESITGRFETSFFMDKTLLTGKESKTTFFTARGMGVLKSLVGDDKLRAELKNSNRHQMIEGTYNVFIVGNPVPVLEFESNEDQSAWYRRLRWVKCRNYKPAMPIPDFAGKLITAEGSGILNWALEGIRSILLSGSSNLPCSDQHKARLNYLFGAADPLNLFLATTVESNHGTTITSDELFAAFTEFSLSMEWQPWSPRQFQKELPNAMLRIFQSPRRRDVQRKNVDGKFTNRSGYFHVRFKQ